MARTRCSEWSLAMILQMTALHGTAPLWLLDLRSHRPRRSCRHHHRSRRPRSRHPRHLHQCSSLDTATMHCMLAAVATNFGIHSRQPPCKSVPKNATRPQLVFPSRWDRVRAADPLLVQHSSSPQTPLMTSGSDRPRHHRPHRRRLRRHPRQAHRRRARRRRRRRHHHRRRRRQCRCRCHPRQYTSPSTVRAL